MIFIAALAFYLSPTLTRAISTIFCVTATTKRTSKVIVVHRWRDEFLRLGDPRHCWHGYSYRNLSLLPPPPCVVLPRLHVYPSCSTSHQQRRKIVEMTVDVHGRNRHKRITGDEYDAFTPISYRSFLKRPLAQCHDPVGRLCATTAMPYSFAIKTSVLFKMNDIQGNAAVCLRSSYMGRL